jgi:hypothetical protein
VSNYKTVAGEYFLLTLLPLIYIYLERLIRDLDSPFDYGSRKSISGSAEVDPYPMRDYRNRTESLRQPGLVYGDQVGIYPPVPANRSLVGDKLETTRYGEMVGR